MSFSTLGLSAEIVRAVTAKGYTDPTPIQLQAIPAVLAGHDLLAGAQTGTGKTAGFTLPILHRLAAQPARTGPGRRAIRALILTPTRELAAQVEESVRDYGKYLKLTSMVIFGGVNITPQIRQLKSGVDILVATPGRLLDHVQQRTVDLSQIEILVLDEADRMLDMGFIRDIRRILSLLPAQRQNLLFSATFSGEIKALAQTLLKQPVLIEVARKQTNAELIDQKIYRVAREQKSDLLTHLIKEHNWYQVLVFTRTKHGADRLAKHLSHQNITTLAIHGNKSQAVRTKTLAKFKEGSVQVLVATDIAARGIDINELPQVVNFDLPDVPEDYVHRIGRTGRAGSTGAALSLVCSDEAKQLTAIERLLKRSIPQDSVPGFAADQGPSRSAKVDQVSRAGDRRGRSAPQSAPRRQPKPSATGTGAETERRESAGAKPTRSNTGRRRRSS